MYKPKSFLVAKEDCKSLGGSLLSLVNTEQVFNAVEDELIGNVLSQFRIDGWLVGNWFQNENEMLELEDMGNKTLTLDLEDGRVSNSLDAETRLGFICQADSMGVAGEVVGCSEDTEVLPNKGLYEKNLQ